MHDLTDMIGANPGDSLSALAINNSGSFAGTVLSPSDLNHQAYMYDGTVHNLGSLGGQDTYPWDINDANEVVGDGYTSNGQTHAFLYDGTMHDLGTLGGTTSDAEKINNAGQVIGGADTSSGQEDPFLYDGTMHDLNDLVSLPAGWTLAYADDINNAGQIVGSAYDGQNYHAVLLNPVPEPSSILALICGIGGFAGVARRRIG